MRAPDRRVSLLLRADYASGSICISRCFVVNREKKLRDTRTDGYSRPTRCYIEGELKYLFCNTCAVFFYTFALSLVSRRVPLFQFASWFFCSQFRCYPISRQRRVYEKKIEVSSNISVIADCDIAIAPTHFAGLKREHIGVARVCMCVYARLTDTFRVLTMIRAITSGLAVA